MPKAFPIEFRNDVVAVARKGEASIAQVAKDFGVSESCLQRWLKLADIEDGKRPGVTAGEAAETRELRKRIRLLEQENEVLRRRCGPASCTPGRHRSYATRFHRGTRAPHHWAHCGHGADMSYMVSATCHCNNSDCC